MRYLLLTLALATLAACDSASGPDDDGRGCAAFATQPQAQAWYEAHGRPHRLDTDADGIACEHLPKG